MNVPDLIFLLRILEFHTVFYDLVKLSFLYSFDLDSACTVTFVVLEYAWVFFT